MKWILIPLFIIISFQTLDYRAEAATKSTKAVVPSISISAQYIKTKNIVRIYFGSISGVSKIAYTLTYQGNGIGQGVIGSFAPGKQTSASKDIYLGTCSGKVCTPQRNIKNIQLEATTKFTNGKSSSKAYTVK